MSDLLIALTKAAQDLVRRDVLWHALWPSLASVLFWGVLGVMFWDTGIALFSRLIPALRWESLAWLSHWAAAFLLLAALITVSYLCALLLVALVALPLLIRRIAQRDYPDLTAHGENVVRGSLINTLGAALVFLVGGLLSLPLLLIPGVILVLPLAWTAWLNQRTFRFDALAEHATRRELAQIVESQKKGFMLAGISTGMLSYIPIVQLLAPAFTALVFVHYGLGSLRRVRHINGVQL